MNVYTKEWLDGWYFFSKLQSEQQEAQGQKKKLCKLHNSEAIYEYTETVQLTNVSDIKAYENRFLERFPDGEILGMGRLLLKKEREVLKRK